MSYGYLKFTAICCVALLAGCNDDDDNNEIEVIPPPTITLDGGTFSERTPVTLSPSISTQGSISSYEWSVLDGPVSIDDSSSSEVSFTAPDVEQDSTVEATLSLTVTDDANQSTSTEVTITFESVSPTISLSSLTLQEKSEATLTAVVDAMDQEIVSAEWRQLDGQTISFTQTSDYEIQITAPETSKDETVTLSLQITDVDGDIVTATTEVTIEQITIPVTIAGIATDAPIANAEITAQADGIETGYSAIADSQGRYEINVIFDDTQVDSLVTLTARGIDNQANAGLISVLGSVEEALNLAGADAILDASESNSVKITNLSTAEYGLAKLVNSGESFESSQSYSGALASVDYNEVLLLASLIKVAIDKSTSKPELALPAEVEDTLELANSMEFTASYFAQVKDTQEFSDAQLEIFSDLSIRDETAWVLEDTYFLQPPPLSSVGILKLSDDLSYEWGEDTGAYEFIDNTLTLKRQENERTFFDLDAGGNVTIECSCYYEVTINRLKADEFGEVWGFNSSFDETYTYQGEDISNVDSIQYIFPVVGISTSPQLNVVDFDNVMLPVPWAFSSETENISGDLFEFSANGTGRAKYLATNFSWEYSSDNKSVNLQLEDGRELNIHSTDRSLTHFATSWVNSPAETEWTEVVSDGVVKAVKTPFIETDVIGYLSYPQSVFGTGFAVWFEFSEDFTGARYSTYDDNDDGIIDSSEFSKTEFNWEIIDGALEMSETDNDFGYTRRMELGASLGNRVIVLAHSYYKWYPGYTSTDIREMIKLEAPPVTINYD